MAGVAGMGPEGTGAYDAATDTIKVSGTIGGVTGGATSAKQDTGNTSLGNIDADLELLKQPTRYAAVTPSDATDVTATATKGLIVTSAGVVNVTGVGDSGAVGLGTWPAGSYIPGALKRVNAATTATVVSCYGP